MLASTSFEFIGYADQIAYDLLMRKGFLGLISPSKTEGKLDRDFWEIKETAPLQTEGAVVECPVTSPAAITLV